MKRIVHVCLRYPPASGGAETYARDIVEGTRNLAEGRDVRVLTSALRTHHPATFLEPELLRQDPAYVQRIHISRTPVLAYPRLQALPYYIAHHQPDLIHGYGFWYQPADSVARYAKRHNLPFIFHPIYYTNEIRRKPIWQLYAKYIGAATFACADAVAVLSPHEQTLIEKAGFPVKRFVLLPPGLHIPEYEAPQLNPFLSRGITGQILLTAGRLAPGKGLEDAIVIFTLLAKQYPDLQLALVGEDFGAQETLMALAKASGLSARIYFLGKLSRTELLGAFQHASVFLHTSHYEAFGIVAAEALICGTPVVARNVAALPYVVPEGKAGFLWQTPEEAAQAVGKLLENPSVREQFGEAGKKYVVDNFSFTNTRKTLLHLYEELGVA